MTNSSLHTLNKTASAKDLNDRLSQAISDIDEVILIEDGVYQCIALYSEPDSSQNAKPWHLTAKTIYAMKDDAIARGIPTNVENICFISYEEFVQLSLKHKKVISWY